MRPAINRTDDFLRIRAEENVRNFRITTLLAGVSCLIYLGVVIFRLHEETIGKWGAHYLVIFSSLAFLSFLMRLILIRRNSAEVFILVYMILASLLLITVAVIDSEEASDFMAYAFVILIFAFVYRVTLIKFILSNILGLIYFVLAYYFFHHRIVTPIFLLPVVFFLIFAAYISQSRERTKKWLFTLALELEKSRNKLVQSAIRDPLTNLYNRRYYNDLIHIQHERFKREGIPYSIILFDIDHFKKVNDKLGHPVGDSVLVEIARLMETLSRKTDIPFRFGGEEFLLVMTGAGLEYGETVAERLRSAVEEFDFSSVPDKITISLGVTTVGNADSLDSLVKRADDCLYEAKKGGRNKAVSC